MTEEKERGGDEEDEGGAEEEEEDEPSCRHVSHGRQKLALGLGCQVRKGQTEQKLLASELKVPGWQNSQVEEEIGANEPRGQGEGDAEPERQEKPGGQGKQEAKEEARVRLE